MGEPESNIIAVKDSHGDWLSIEFNWDASLGKWIRMFVIILEWIGFSKETISEILAEGWEDWMWNDD